MGAVVDKGNGLQHFLALSKILCVGHFRCPKCLVAMDIACENTRSRSDAIKSQSKLSSSFAILREMRACKISLGVDLFLKTTRADLHSSAFIREVLGGSGDPFDEFKKMELDVPERLFPVATLPMD